MIWKFLHSLDIVGLPVKYFFLTFSSERIHPMLRRRLKWLPRVTPQQARLRLSKNEKHSSVKLPSGGNWFSSYLKKKELVRKIFSSCHENKIGKYYQTSSPYPAWFLAHLNHLEKCYTQYIRVSRTHVICLHWGVFFLETDSDQPVCWPKFCNYGLKGNKKNYKVHFDKITVGWWP